MIEYGRRKRGSGKIHPHNKCSVCSEINVSKKRERQRAKEEVVSGINETFEVEVKLCGHKLKGKKMKLKVSSVDFETNELTLVIPENIADKCRWCFGDELEIDLSMQLSRPFEPPKEE